MRRLAWAEVDGRELGPRRATAARRRPTIRFGNTRSAGHSSPNIGRRICLLDGVIARITSRDAGRRADRRVVAAAARPARHSGQGGRARRSAPASGFRSPRRELCRPRPPDTVSVPSTTTTPSGPSTMYALTGTVSGLPRYGGGSGLLCLGVRASAPEPPTRRNFEVPMAELELAIQPNVLSQELRVAARVGAGLREVDGARHLRAGRRPEAACRPAADDRGRLSEDAHPDPAPSGGRTGWSSGGCSTAQPPQHVEYRLSELGETLAGPLVELCHWAMDNLDAVPAGPQRERGAAPRGNPIPACGRA